MKFDTDGHLEWEKSFTDMGNKSFSYGIEIVNQTYVIYFSNPSSQENVLTIMQ